MSEHLAPAKTGALLLLPQSACQLGRETTALQRHPRAHPAATNAREHDPDGGGKVPPAPTGARQEAGVTQDDPSRRCQNTGVFPEGQAPLGLAR